MTQLQQYFANWMGMLVDHLPVGYAFGAGMMSTVNPCGFALLPVYLSLYLGTQESGFYQTSPLLRGLKALMVAAMVSAGFVALFAAMGVLISAGGRILIAAMPWIAMVIGLGLTVLGLWMLTGRHLSLGLFSRLGSRIGDPRTTGIRGFFLFGLAFGATSLSCTLPIFLVVVGSALAAGSFLAGMAQFFSYGLGMGVVLLLLTLAVALFKEGLMVARIRKVMPYVHHVTAVLLILAGSYIIYYWLFPGGMLVSFS
ncbi:MAG: cytochrome c biogenesis protein CcdA [SAR324 cluster bacterium]|nr:cytochrome c biogenesis protein CcdA [SAR324 cluster bacterium]